VEEEFSEVRGIKLTCPDGAVGHRGGAVRYSPECVEWGFSEVPHSPGPMRQGFLCRVLGMRSPAYIRHCWCPQPNFVITEF